MGEEVKKHWACLAMRMADGGRPAETEDGRWLLLAAPKLTPHLSSTSGLDSPAVIGRVPSSVRGQQLILE